MFISDAKLFATKVRIKTTIVIAIVAVVGNLAVVQQSLKHTTRGRHNCNPPRVFKRTKMGTDVL
jgi:hypothetical protein